MNATALRSINPATGTLIAEYSVHDPAQVRHALGLASEQAAQWGRLSFAERATHLRAIARVLRERQPMLALLATVEMGKPIAQSRAEIEKCAATLAYYAEQGATYLQDEMVATDARKSYVSFRPLGVVLAVMPWNFPFWQVFRAMAPALMAGNTMVLKHASNVCGCARAIEDVVRESGAPAGLFQSLLIPGAQVADLIALPEIAAVTFTGSTSAGKQVAAAAGAHVKKQVLELGGSDAYIVLEDADLDLAVQVGVRGRLVNSGQSCVAAKRFVVLRAVYDEFEQRMTQQMKQASFGDPMDEANQIGPLARVDLRDDLHEQVMRSVARGAVITCGGYTPPGAGAFYPPTVLAGVRPGMPAYDEELFGPVASLIIAEDEADAVRIANDSIYGLGAGIFSQNRERAERIAATQLDAGNCFVNAFVHSDARLPFGGVKQSGYGRELSGYGIREFTNIKTVFIQ